MPRVENCREIIKQSIFNKVDFQNERCIPQLYFTELVLKFTQFHSPHIYLCLSEETLKADGPFYLVSMPGEIKDPTQGANV